MELICINCGASIPKRWLQSAEFRPHSYFHGGEIWRSIPEMHFVASIYDAKGNEINVKAFCTPLEYVEDSEITSLILSGRK